MGRGSITTGAGIGVLLGVAVLDGVGVSSGVLPFFGVPKIPPLFAFFPFFLMPVFVAQALSLSAVPEILSIVA